MADPLPPLTPPSALSRIVNEWDRLTPEAQRAFIALWARVNEIEARVAALEP